MVKSQLIEKLQSINGNPVILLEGSGMCSVPLKKVQLEKMHQSKDDPEEYVTDFEYERETEYNTFFRDNYKEEADGCIVLGII